MLPFTHDVDLDESPRATQRYDAPEIIELDPDDPILLCDGIAEPDGDAEGDAGEPERATTPYPVVLGYDGTD